MEFEHSVYGGNVMLICEPAGDKIKVLRMVSDSRAAIEYYSGDYFIENGSYVVEINQSFGELLVNGGWKISGEGFDLVTGGKTKIYVCR
jgi:hypothetical protein